MIPVTHRHRKKSCPVPAQGTRVVTTVHMASTLNATTQPAKAASASQEKERKEKKRKNSIPWGRLKQFKFVVRHAHTHTKAGFGNN